MLSSTALNPLFVFFSQKPRIKSVASRHIEHVKLTNKVDSEGSLVLSAQDQLKALVTDLDVRFTLGEEVKWDVLVIDTGDELQQVMKESRRIRNRGDWGVGDWVWLGDAYGALMQTLIDLPMHVIVNFHLTTSHDGPDGELFREVDLQGGVKDQWAGWFDVVAALDTFETIDEKGNSESKRVLLAHSSRMYPWVKDHSGNMPSRWEVSENFVGDFPRLLELVMGDTGEVADDQKRQVVGTIGDVALPGPGPATGQNVPTPAELADVKAQRGAEPPPEPTQAAIDTKPEPAINKTAEQGADVEPLEQAQAIVEEQLTVEEVVEPTLPDPPSSTDVQVSAVAVEVATGDPADLQATVAQNGKHACGWDADGQACGTPIDDEDLADLSLIRFQKVYCRPHFKEALKKGAGRGTN